MNHWGQLGFLGNLGTHSACSNCKNRHCTHPHSSILAKKHQTSGCIISCDFLILFLPPSTIDPWVTEGFILHRWGETRTFPLAVWPPYRRCAGLETRPRKAESKSAPLIARCRYKAGCHSKTKMMMMDIFKNAAVGQTDLFVSRFFSSDKPGH